MNVPREIRNESYKRLNSNSIITRKEKIVMAYKKHGNMTARECASILGFVDLNAVKPRISELYQEGILESMNKKFDNLTERMVSVFKISNRGSEVYEEIYKKTNANLNEQTSTHKN